MKPKMNTFGNTLFAHRSMLSMAAHDAFSGSKTKYISKNKQNIYDKILGILKDFISKSMLKNEVLLFYLK